MREDPDGSVVITLRDVYDKVVSVEGSMQSVSGLGPQVVDHESRLRRLEKWHYAFPASLLCSAGSVLLAIYGGHHG